MLRSVPDLLNGITLVAGDRGLRAIRFGASEAAYSEDPILVDAEKQLREYAAGARFAFDLPLDPEGTPFQLEVWRALVDIPYAETRSYRDIARAVTAFRPSARPIRETPCPS
jgi:methylated-DNA-[protein]-cysteine S-methyltransferase